MRGLIVDAGGFGVGSAVRSRGAIRLSGVCDGSQVVVRDCCLNGIGGINWTWCWMLGMQSGQSGNCNGCGTHFMPQHLTVDHIIARSKGGNGHLENLQLLCGHCNSLKGNRPMEYLRGSVGAGVCMRVGVEGV